MSKFVPDSHPNKPVQVKRNPAPEDSLSRVTNKPHHLPSRGIPYPKGFELSYRPFKFGEIKRISSSKNSTPRQMFEEVLSGVDCSFDKEDLTLSDILFIGLLRKISTLGTTDVILKYRCGKCKEVGNHRIKTDDLEFTDLLADYSDDEAQLPVSVEFSWGEENFTPLTLKDYYRLLDNNLEHSEIAKFSMEASHYGEGWEERYKKFDDLEDLEDMRLLQEVEKLLYHELKPIEFECNIKVEGKVCGNKIHSELDGGQALILPFRERKVDVKGRIRLGSKVEH